MTAVPLVCTKDEQRSVIHFFGQKVCKVLKFTCVCVHSLGEMLSWQSVYSRREVFKSSQTNVTGEECSVFPST
jgi:hypothetical protein